MNQLLSIVSLKFLLLLLRYCHEVIAVLYIIIIVIKNIITNEKETNTNKMTLILKVNIS